MGQGNKFTGVCLSTRGGCLTQIFGGGVCSKFWGGRVWPKFSGGGVWPKFTGGSAPNFRGGEGSEIFFSFFFQFIFPPKNSSGMHNLPPPPTPRDGQCAAGTHPTGMHSCFYFVFENLRLISVRRFDNEQCRYFLEKNLQWIVEGFAPKKLIAYFCRVFGLEVLTSNWEFSLNIAGGGNPLVLTWRSSNSQ